MVRAMHYSPDFQFDRQDRGFQAEWRTVVIEAKGHKTQPYQMRKKLFLAPYPDIAFQEWTRETLKQYGG